VREIEQRLIEKEAFAFAQFVRERAKSGERKQDADEDEKKREAVPAQERQPVLCLRAQYRARISRHALSADTSARRSSRRGRRNHARCARRATSRLSRRR